MSNQAAKMSPFEREMMLEQVDSTNEKDTSTKNGPHYALAGRPIMGSSLMAQGLVAAYKTINSEFQIHHLTTQFLRPGDSKLPLKFEVTRTNDAKNNAGRTVAISQNGTTIAVIVMSFMRRPILDNQSLAYQPKLPLVEEPIEDIDDMRFAGQGLIKAQALGRKFEPDAVNFGDNKTYHWVKIPGISAGIGDRIHHSGLIFISDHFLLDCPVRLFNLQLGFGEPKVSRDQKDSPYNRRTTKEEASRFKNPSRSDLKAMLTLNHTVHFHNPECLRADEWLLMEANTSSAFGGRVLSHSKIFSRDGNIGATCTQEGYCRVREDAISKI